jgi:TPP-dependent pyruvate/acetoin dehydrogenase alpha subunit
LQERDPVERVKKLLLAKGYDASAIKAIEKAVKKEVDSAVEESKVSVRRSTRANSCS